MPSTSSYLSTISALTPSVVAQVNPNASGACYPTQGGAEACGPNGSEAWLNTGLTTNGWTPPFLDINDLVVINITDYYNGAGAACAQYDEYFQSTGAKYDINPVILAVLAMQESSCNPAADTSIDSGLMQCDPSNCQNGQSSCQWPIQDNVDCGGWVLREALDSGGGNAILALGAYNGWFTGSDYPELNNGEGLTQSYPCSAAGQANGAPQNLDYVFEVLNGWLQGYDLYDGDANLEGSYNCIGYCTGSNLC